MYIALYAVRIFANIRNRKIEPYGLGPRSCKEMTYDVESQIDYSPNPSATDFTITLTEQNLREARMYQIERFLRVWVSDRLEYAPKLTHLTIELVADENNIGISKFLHCLQGVHRNALTSIYIRNMDDSCELYK